MILRSLHGRMLDDGCKEGRNVKLPLEDYVFSQRSNFIILNQAVTTMKMSWQKQAAQHSEIGFYNEYKNEAPLFNGEPRGAQLEGTNETN